MKRGGHTVCAGNSLEGGESKMHRWRIQNVVLWNRKQKEWCGNHIEKRAYGQGSGIMLNIICAYAPQVGCIREEKEAFWLDLDETVEDTKK